jgi:hypothetical protein
MEGQMAFLLGWFDSEKKVLSNTGFIVKNPSKRSVSLKNGLEENKSKIQCQKTLF